MRLSITLVALTLPLTLPAAVHEDQLRKHMKFYGISEEKVNAETLAKLAAAKAKAEAPETSVDERQKAYAEIVQVMGPAMMGALFPASQVQNLAQTLARSAEYYSKLPDKKPFPTRYTPPGKLGEVKVAGKGSQSLLLIPGFNADASIFDEFMARNANRYKMVAVTLPGWGGTPPYQRPDTFNPGKLTWTKSVEQALINAIKENKLDKPVVIGNQQGGYWAARLAATQPELVRGAILIDTPTRQPMYFSKDGVTTPVPFEMRQQRAMTSPGTLLGDLTLRFWTDLPTTEKRLREVKGWAVPYRAATKDEERAIAMSAKAEYGRHPDAMLFQAEYAATDLTADLKNLKVPILAIAPVHDDKSPQFFTLFSAQTWEEFLLEHTGVPVTLARWYNVRSYLTEETPRELDEAVAAFAAGRPVGDRFERTFLVRPSPRAELDQMLSNTAIHINYGRPGIKGRPLAKLAPPGQVWRAGADEATTISFSTPVKVEGRDVPAGKYTLFYIPGESEWTLVLNKVQTTWGSFTYRPDLDLVRIPLKPSPAEHQERMLFSFDDIEDKAGTLNLRWERVRVPVKIEAGS